MKRMAIRKQARLGFARTAEICLNGISYRLFRSLVTVAIVGVAVAFMMHTLGGSMIGRAVNHHASAEVERYRAYDRWLSWTDETMDRPTLFRILADCAEDDPEIRSVQQWGGLSDEQTADLLAVSRELGRYTQFFEKMPPGRQFVLAGSAEAIFLPDWLLNGDTLRQFSERLANMPGIRAPLSTEELHDLLRRYERQASLWDRVLRERNRAARELRARYHGRGISDLMTSPPPDFLNVLEELGFADASLDFSELFDKALHERRVNELAALLRNREFRRDIAGRAGVEPGMATMQVFGEVFLARGGPEFVRETMERYNLETGLDPGQMRGAFENYLRESRMLSIESESAIPAGGGFGFDIRTLWMIGVSLVVCIVGIANAMLMSVMERFREIATMKCLGATNSFVMTLFIMESCIQGLVGGIIGAALGLMLAVPAAAIRYGSLVWSTFPLHDMTVIVFAAMGTGALLAAVASVYPAFVGARLVPMEAMRLE